MDEFKSRLCKCSSSKNDAAGVTRTAAPLGVCRQIQMWLLNNMMYFVRVYLRRTAAYTHNNSNSCMRAGARYPHKYSKMIQPDDRTCSLSSMRALVFEHLNKTQPECRHLGETISKQFSENIYEMEL